jgi:hypothetical protein
MRDLTILNSLIYLPKIRSNFLLIKMENITREDNIVNIECTSVRNQPLKNDIYLKCSLVSIVITIITFMLFLQFLAFIITLPYRKLN